METIIDSADEFYSEIWPWETRVVPAAAPISGAFDSPQLLKVGQENHYELKRDCLGFSVFGDDVLPNL